MLSLFRKPEKFSLKNLEQLHTQLDKFRAKLESDNQTRQRKQNDKDEPAIVQSIKEISEIVIYGDKSTNDELFALFCQKDFLTLFNRIMYLTRHKGIQIQILQTVMILLQNVRTTESLHYIFSNNHLNNLINAPIDSSNEELLAYYISFLKTVSLRIDEATLVYFFDERSQQCPSFPLYTSAIQFFGHKDSMVRTAVRTITLNIYRVRSQALQRFLSTGSRKEHFDNVAKYFMRLLSQLQLHLAIFCVGKQGWEVKFECLSPSSGAYEKSVSCVPFASPKTTNRVLTRLWTRVLDDWQDVNDLLFYIDDTFNTAWEEVQNCLRKSILENVARPVLLKSVRTAYVMQAIMEHYPTHEIPVSHIPCGERFASYGYEYPYILNEVFKSGRKEHRGTGSSSSITNASPMHLLFAYPCLRNVTPASQSKIPWCVYPSSILFESFSVAEEQGGTDNLADHLHHIDPSIAILTINQMLRIIQDSAIRNSLVEQTLFNAPRFELEEVLPRKHRQAFEILLGSEVWSGVNVVQLCADDEATIISSLDGIDQRLRECVVKVLWTVSHASKTIPTLLHTSSRMMRHFPEISAMLTEQTAGCDHTGFLSYHTLCKAGLGHQLPTEADWLVGALVSPHSTKSRSFPSPSEFSNLLASKDERRGRLKSHDNYTSHNSFQRNGFRGHGERSDLGVPNDDDSIFSDHLTEEAKSRDDVLKRLVNCICADSTQLETVHQFCYGDRRGLSTSATDRAFLWDRYTHGLIPMTLLRLNVSILYHVCLPLAVDVIGEKLAYTDRSVRQNGTPHRSQEPCLQGANSLHLQSILPAQVNSELRNTISSVCALIQRSVEFSEDSGIGGCVNIVNVFDAVSFSTRNEPSAQASINVSREPLAAKVDGSSLGFVGSPYSAEQAHRDAKGAISEAAELTSEIYGEDSPTVPGEATSYSANGYHIQEETNSLLSSAFSPEIEELDKCTPYSQYKPIRVDHEGTISQLSLTDTQISEAAAEITAVAVLRQAASNAVPQFGEQQNIHPLNKIHLFWVCIQRLYLVRNLLLKLAGLHEYSDSVIHDSVGENEVLQRWDMPERLFLPPKNSSFLATDLGSVVPADATFFVCCVPSQQPSFSFGVALREYSLDFAEWNSIEEFTVIDSIPFQYLRKPSREGCTLRLTTLIWDFYEPSNKLFSRVGRRASELEQRILPMGQSEYKVSLEFESPDIADNVLQSIESQKSASIQFQLEQLEHFSDRKQYEALVDALTDPHFLEETFSEEIHRLS
eukprot:gb/GECG01005541.1/.p1 GENE.gb/GECG01005541.1/~~gb/GECG01005541.1/.p1  ORF type:complete len:1258 (+),score=126.39 gb/GECG01005541.1/:1-3774(+)